MIEDRNRLIVLCRAGQKRKDLDNDRYNARLKAELHEIDVQEEHPYFLDLYDKKIKYPYNEHNSIIPFLLDIVPDFDIDKEVAYSIGDYPDIDVDYLPEVQQYLKNEWAPNTFGKENVCNIGNYSTFGIKSALIDMTRVHGGDRQAILELTTKLDNKDEDGKPITFEKALESNPGLAEFCKANPAIADSAKNLLNRNRGRGKHAGGLIISRTRIDELVPLVIDKDGQPVSAWPEGLHSTDLGPMGFVKYDILVVTNLKQIAKCAKFVKERHGLGAICNLPDLNDWSDTSYLEDKLAIKIANEGKLKCVFQFDSPGIRDMIKRGGVANFEDLVAYTSLYRPGPMQCLPQNILVSTANGKKKIKDLKTWYDEIKYLGKDKEVKSSKRFVLSKTGKKKIYKITTKSGKIAYAAANHPYLTKNGYVLVKNLKKGIEILHSDTI